MPASTRARALILAFTFALLLALSLVPTVMTVRADSPDTVWAATNLGLYRSDDGGATWQFNPISADGFTPAAPRGEIPPTAVGGGPVAVDPRDPNKIYYFGGNGTVAGEGIFRSSDHGRTWSYKSLIDSTPAAQNGTDPRLPVTEENWFDKQCQLCLDYANPDNWYIGIWRSSDAGNTWQKMSIQNTRGVAPDPTVSGLVYAPQAPGLLVSHDYGATFTKLNVSGSAVGEYGVFVDPTTGDAYTSGGKTGVTKSSDGGTTWIDLPLQGGVPVSFDWANGDVYRGNYRSTDHGASWRIYTDPSTGLAGGFHNFLAIDPNASGHAFRWSVGDASPSGVFQERLTLAKPGLMSLSARQYAPRI